MKEQVIHSLRPVGKCNPACYPPSVIQIPLGPASWYLDDFGWISGRIALSNRVLGQYPPPPLDNIPPDNIPRTISPRTISPQDNIPPDNIPPDNIPPYDISSKTCFSKKKMFNFSVLNYPKTCVGKNFFFFF